MPASVATRNAVIDPIRSIQRATYRPPSSPSRRDVAECQPLGPYMHNGVFQSLDEVVDFATAEGHGLESAPARHCRRISSSDAPGKSALVASCERDRYDGRLPAVIRACSLPVILSERVCENALAAGGRTMNRGALR